jgi:hypothetical protein|tara:strand:- start:1257 stop:1463 length:207 start_codon:yes stop_codon:yes gene_type:complete
LTLATAKATTSLPGSPYTAASPERGPIKPILIGSSVEVPSSLIRVYPPQMIKTATKTHPIIFPIISSN